MQHISEIILTDEAAFNYAKELIENGTFQEQCNMGLALGSGKTNWWTRVMLAGLFIQTKGFKECPNQ